MIIPPTLLRSAMRTVAQGSTRSREEIQKEIDQVDRFALVCVCTLLAMFLIPAIGYLIYWLVK